MNKQDIKDNRNCGECWGYITRAKNIIHQSIIDNNSKRILEALIATRKEMEEVLYDLYKGNESETKNT